MLSCSPTAWMMTMFSWLQRAVAREEHAPHPAAAELSDQLVLIDARAGGERGAGVSDTLVERR
jgi:hypothetical protein